MNRKLFNIYLQLPTMFRTLAINLYGFYRARQRFGGDFKKLLADLNRTQWLSTKRLKEFQIEALRKMVEYAYNSTDYYHKLFIDHGLSPKDIQTLEDLKRIPILKKETIRKNFHALVSKNFPQNNRFLHSSSGTTGEKLYFYLPKYLRWKINYAHLYRFYKWAGFKPYDRRVTIGARVFTRKPPYWVFNKFENQLLLSIHHLNYETVGDYVKIIKKFSPHAIQGHPSGIYLIAEYLKQKKDKIPVKAILTSSETLFDDQRRVMEEVFVTHVYDVYHMGEAVVMAAQCEQHLEYHEACEYGIMEVINVKNGIGEIIGTSLHNFAMPFIRYKIGDLAEIAKKESCTCGRGLPLKIKRILGRIDDRLMLEHNRIVLAVTVRMAIKPLLEEGENYQFIQETTKDFHLKILTNNFHSKKRRRLIAALKTILGEKANIYIENVKEIPLVGGKIRNVISKVK